MTDEDGRPRGFAFVNMEDADAGAAAVDALNETEIDGRTVSVWTAHGALPHRAPPTRRTAESVHHVWGRSPSQTHFPDTS